MRASPALRVPLRASPSAILYDACAYVNTRNANDIGMTYDDMNEQIYLNLIE
jgi:hypothetical protein